MRADRITVTLARDVPPGGRVGDTEAALLAQLETVVASLGGEVVEAPAPYRNNPVGRTDQYQIGRASCRERV